VGTIRTVVASTRLSVNAKALVSAAGRRSLQHAHIISTNTRNSRARLQGASISLSITDTSPVKLRYSRIACQKRGIQCGRYHSEAAHRITMDNRNDAAQR